MAAIDEAITAPLAHERQPARRQCFPACLPDNLGRAAFLTMFVQSLIQVIPSLLLVCTLPYLFFLWDAAGTLKTVEDERSLWFWNWILAGTIAAMVLLCPIFTALGLVASGTWLTGCHRSVQRHARRMLHISTMLVIYDVTFLNLAFALVYTADQPLSVFILWPSVHLIASLIILMQARSDSPPHIYGCYRCAGNTVIMLVLTGGYSLMFISSMPEGAPDMRQFTGVPVLCALAGGFCTIQGFWKTRYVENQEVFLAFALLVGSVLEVVWSGVLGGFSESWVGWDAPEPYKVMVASLCTATAVVVGIMGVVGALQCACSRTRHPGVGWLRYAGYLNMCLLCLAQPAIAIMDTMHFRHFGRRFNDPGVAWAVLRQPVVAALFLLAMVLTTRSLLAWTQPDRHARGDAYARVQQRQGGLLEAGQGSHGEVVVTSDVVATEAGMHGHDHDHAPTS